MKAVLKSAGYPEFHLELRHTGARYEIAKVDHRGAPERHVAIDARTAVAIQAMDDYDAMHAMLQQIEAR